MDIFTDIILPLIENSGKSDMELEREMHLPRSIIYDWRNGRSKSYKKYAAEIAAYFNVSTDYVLGNEQTEKPTTPSNETPDLKHLLENAHGLMFNGEPLSDDDRKQILKVIQALQDK